MQEVFTIRIFYADGGPPESGERRISDLLPKWMGICDDLLADYGPVMKHNLGSTLSHFDIAMAGPMVELLAFGRTCFRLAISLGTGSEQDRATVMQALPHEQPQATLLTPIATATVSCSRPVSR